LGDDMPAGGSLAVPIRCKSLIKDEESRMKDKRV
jgi:hypothetical protein